MPVWINANGEVAYGYSAVSVDGAVPAPLAGRTVGQPAWQSATQLVYQDGDVGLGPWITNRITYPGVTVDTVDTNGVNTLRGGGGIWAKWVGALNQVLTSDPDVGPFTGAFIGDVSADPYVVVLDDYQTGIGLTVYDDTGATVLALPTAAVANNQNIRLRDGYLSYQDQAGKWHLVHVSDGLTPSWYPRTDGVNWTVPLVHQGTLYLLERTESLSLRPANRARGWVLSATPNTFDPDAISYSGLIRAASCLTIGCETTSLQVFDCTILQDGTGNLSVQVGTVSGGGIVYAAASSMAFTSFVVGALEGSSLTPQSWAPVQTAMVAKEAKVTEPWARYFRDLDRKLNSLGGVVESQPDPVDAFSGFTQVDSPGQPSAQATPVADVLTLTSTDGSMIFQINPSSNTVDLAVRGGGFGYAPMSTGAEPLEIMSNGAGQVLMVGFNP